MDNKFIDTATGSVDIKSTYVGFPNLSQTLTTASKYMYIKPGTDGNFQIKINGISNVVLGTDWSVLATATQFTSSWQNTAGVLMGFINPNPPAGVSPTMRIMGTSDQYIYYNTGNNFGNYNSTTSTTNWEITSVGNFTTNGFITSTGILSLKNGANIPILLDPTTTSGNRLQIYGVAGGTKYLFFNTSNNIGVFNTATSANVWSIDGTTGNINTIGTLTYATLSATSFLCNSISPVSGTVIAIGITSQFYWLKAAGVGRVSIFANSTSGDIMQIFRVGDNAQSSGYWYFNNTGNNGYINAGVVVWELLNNGDITTSTQIKTNTISPYSGTVINISALSEFNWLKASGVSRARLFPTLSSGDIFTLFRTADNVVSDGYWYWNTLGNCGYYASGVKWEILNNGGMNLVDLVSSGYLRSNFLYAYTF